MDGYLINVAKEAQLSLALALEKLNNVSITASAFPLDHSSKGVYELKRESDSVKSLARNLSTLTASGYNYTKWNGHDAQPENRSRKQARS